MLGNHPQVRIFPYEQAMLKELNVAGYSSLVDMFEQACERYRQRPAFTALGHTLTFDDVDRLSRDFAAYLLGPAGLVPGLRIAVQLPNLCQYPVVAWGALRAGMVLVNTNPMYSKRELLHQFTDAGVSAVVCLADLLPNLEPLLPHTGIERVIVTSAIDLIEAQPAPPSALSALATLPQALSLGADCKLPDLALGMNDIALLQYTSGTTGVAKGVVLTHGNILTSTRQYESVAQVDPAALDVLLAPMPLYHSYGFTVNIVGTFCAGGQSVLIPDPRDIGSMIEIMKTCPVTSLAGVNMLFQAMMHHPEFDTIDFSHLRSVIAGGAALIEDIAREWERRTGCQIIEAYGLSETTSALSCNRPAKLQLGTAGIPMPWLQVKIVGGSGEVLAAGEEGELLVRGPQVMHGYWRRPTQTDGALDAQGWLRTGDIAIVQEDGFLRVLDRADDTIRVCGFNVYPNEIEDVVCGHPDVLECAAVGVSDDSSGEAVKLFVVTSNPELDVESLQGFCRKRLTAYKVPRSVEFRQHLPRTNVGKMLRRELLA
jgi:long-chain acyl-CoA synthetase